MNKKIVVLISVSFILMSFVIGYKEININNNKPQYVIVIHGGAGYISAKSVSKEKQKKYIAKLNEALMKGKEILEKGGKALDAVEETIKILENSPLFNAGKGAVFTNNGKNELDASIMDGQTHNAGAVAGVIDIKNPITAARAVMEKSPHVLLSGNGASVFAKNQGLEIVKPKYFYTKSKWKRLQKVLKKSGTEKFGTVGCVALDKHGNLAAGTSTGGMTNKKYGRIGDSPIIGAGTYADNNTCAVSCTGHGEFFIRYAIAHSISAIIEHKNLDVKSAAKYVFEKKLNPAKGAGGVIVVDKNGNIAIEFNTSGMFRAYYKSSGEKEILMFK